MNERERDKPKLMSKKMNKLLIIPILLFCCNLFSQQVQSNTSKTNVNISEQRELNLKPESTIINVPLESDLSKYKKIVLSIMGANYSINKNRVPQAIRQSKFILEKKNFKKGKTKMKEDTLYLFWTCSKEYDDITTTLVIRDYNFKVLYSATYTNIGTSKILSFIMSI
ncbi:hypothetical protein GCM10023314_16080 [Algibacter agarivorans]|uniref:Uncharacterized protein n=1 Tax=Algibacter agarivorans TaxID=1109741 RepID=A0ABP9GR27_9FLAO